MKDIMQQSQKAAKNCESVFSICGILMIIGGVILGLITLRTSIITGIVYILISIISGLMFVYIGRAIYCLLNCMCALIQNTKRQKFTPDWIDEEIDKL